MNVNNLINQKVFVYFNLRKHLLSVRLCETGLVVGHTDEITLRDAIFKVSEAGRQRVIREKSKNVHAGVQGIITNSIVDTLPTGLVTAVTYNPYKYSTFVEVDTEHPIHECEIAHLHRRRVYAYR